MEVTTAAAGSVPAGYKQTEVGVIPDDWEVCSVGQKGQVVTGKALAPNAPGAMRPYLRTKNVFDGRIDIGDVLTMPMTDEQFEQFRLRRGDVLLNEGQSLELVGRCAMYEDEYPVPCAIQNQLVRFRARSGVSGGFACHLFRYSQQTGVFARIALQTTSIAHLGGARFERLRLGWPKREAEQEAIARALSDVDALLAALDRLIAKKRHIKQAAMQQLLTGSTRLAGNRGEWRLLRFGEIASPRREKVNPVVAAARTFCIELEHVESATGRLLGSTTLGDNSSIKTVFKDGDVLFGKLRAYLRKFWLATRSGVCSTEIWSLVGNRSLVTSSYLYQVVQEQRFIEAASNAYGTHMPRSDWSVVSNYELRLPPVDEQGAIAAVLMDMDNELEALEKRRAKTLALKQGMMQELLTGGTRLV